MKSKKGRSMTVMRTVMKKAGNSNDDAQHDIRLQFAIYSQEHMLNHYQMHQAAYHNMKQIYAKYSMLTLE